MLTVEQSQRIIDKFHIGKVSSCSFLGFFYELTTNQGTFFILFDDPFKARSTELKRLIVLKGVTKGNIERLLLPNYKGELIPENSYVHMYNTYFSVYKLTK